MTERPILAARQLQMTFQAAESSLEVLEEATFEVLPNEFICLIGPSGCGKSTLLRILGGLVAPTGGQVLLDGQPLDGPQQRIGFVFQHHNLMPWRTALANVRLPLEIQRVPRDEAEGRARAMLELVGLGEFAEALPRDLSGGMRQRVALARELVYDPDVLLLDEPFGALDALTREQLNWELLRIWQARRKTVIMVTHSIQEAIFLSDRVLVMSPRPGRIERQVEIDLPRPRSTDDLYTPRFLELSRTLRAALGQRTEAPLG
jgi:NitT/TauT family transport system ATP-binding protein